MTNPERREFPKNKPKERFSELQNPGDPQPEECTPGSIEQKLDMCEEGSLKGDEILHRHGRRKPKPSGDPKPIDKDMNENFNVDMSEPDREGDEWSGDEHSFGSGDQN